MVKKIYSDLNITIIEWTEEGNVVRGKLPFTVDRPTEDMLSLALPYGIAWKDAILPYISNPDQIAEELDKNLNNARIFTLSDLQRADPNMVLGLLLKSYGIDYNLFLKHIQNFMEYRNG